MDAATVSPKMDWDSQDLVSAWQSFRQHANFWFKGPLNEKEEAEKCSYLMIWIGDKGRDIYSTWNLSEADAKKLTPCLPDLKIMSGQNRIEFSLGINSGRGTKKKQKLLNSTLWI